MNVRQPERFQVINYVEARPLIEGSVVLLLWTIYLPLNKDKRCRVHDTEVSNNTEANTLSCFRKVSP